MSNPMIELTPELRAAITQVFNDGQQNWDHGDGVPDEDNHPEIAEQYEMVQKLTTWNRDDMDSLGYGVNIEKGCRVELSPSYDLWMQGARFGEVTSVGDEMASVRMDHPQVKRILRIPVKDLKRI